MLLLLFSFQTHIPPLAKEQREIVMLYLSSCPYLSANPTFSFIICRYSQCPALDRLAYEFPEYSSMN